MAATDAMKCCKAQRLVGVVMIKNCSTSENSDSSALDWSESQTQFSADTSITTLFT